MGWLKRIPGGWPGMDYRDVKTPIRLTQITTLTDSQNETPPSTSHFNSQKNRTRHTVSVPDSETVLGLLQLTPGWTEEFELFPFESCCNLP
jgi:hypothetical protein